MKSTSPRPERSRIEPLRPALACIEVQSIAIGYEIVDGMAKQAPIQVLEASTICPGKFVVIIGGEEEAVRESHGAGLEGAGAAVVDHLLLPNAHEQIIPAITATAELAEMSTVGVVETFAVASAILAADAACKEAAIQLIELRLARGLGGKGFFTMTGDQADVEASVGAAEAILGRESGLLLRTVVIPRPHDELRRWLA